ncbi:hypothetical protein ACFQ5N_08715 [Lutibacter holmesii]|uniref:Tetratricopeptide repeat protein n=1 Tax=Lutibacter holmesii TaxID=1137985 RepID=A0ABW3WNT6_9FLAO
MKNLLYVLTFIITTTVIAQQSNTIAFEKSKLQLAKSYGDESMITSSIYNIIALEGPQSTYKDSLAYIYFSERAYVSCFLVTNDLLKGKPDHIEFLEMNAVSLESMGALEKAIDVYKKIFAKTNNNYQGYKLASIQYRAGKDEDAYATIKKADQLPDDGTLKMTFQVNENYNQNVDLKPSIAYLEGLIAQNLNKTAEAKICYERAIQLSPKFVLAKSKLEILNAQEEAQK